MIISAHQPAYNPWLGFIHKILLSDTFVVMDDVQFEKNSFINRNKILQNNNEVMLTIPVKTKNYKSKTLKEIEVVDGRWQIKHLKSIEQAYKKSKYFDTIFEQLKKIYEIKSNFLINYTDAYLKFIVDYLEIETKIVWASDLNIEAKKLDYVVELTKKLDGDIFVFGSQGKNYADVDYIQQKNITAYFQEYNHPIYTQLGTKFYPYMGIIDLLFNEDKEKIKEIILNQNISKDELRSFNV
jgi:hypothetical protein